MRDATYDIDTHDNQRILDCVAYHFITLMTPPAKQSSGSCFYNDEKYGRCAIGIFLDDETGQEWDLEGYAAPDTMPFDGEENSPFISSQRSFLTAIQSWHDTVLEDDMPRHERIATLRLAVTKFPDIDLNVPESNPAL